MGKFEVEYLKPIHRPIHRMLYTTDKGGLLGVAPHPTYCYLWITGSEGGIKMPYNDLPEFIETLQTIYKQHKERKS